MLIEVIQGDITRQATDAIVNAANRSLLGGGGVDAAIHHAAGPSLLDACRRIPEVRPGVRCPTGEARATPGFDLPAQYVIHTVGPVWQGGAHGEADLLAACYRNSLDLARELHVERMAFPAISCGVYAYPVPQAAQVAMAAIHAQLAYHGHPAHVIMCCFSEVLREVFEKALDDGQR